MFNLSAVSQENSGSFSCTALFHTSEAAEQARASFIGPVRQISIFSDLYCTGPQLILETNNRETLIKTADILNHAIIWD